MSRPGATLSQAVDRALERHGFRAGPAPAPAAPRPLRLSDRLLLEEAAWHEAEAARIREEVRDARR